MKVILLDNIENLGEAGEVVEVADGYARNYLVPRGLAEEATPENIARWEQEKALLQQQIEEKRKEARELADSVDGLEIQITARAGEGDKLFGSVTASDIGDAIKEESGIEIDTKDIALGDPLRELGEHEVEISLYEGISATITVEVVPQTEEE